MLPASVARKNRDREANSLIREVPQPIPPACSAGLVPWECGAGKRNPHSNRLRTVALCVLALILIMQGPLFAQTQPAPQPEDTLLFRDGEILLSKGETEKALWRFKQLVTDFPTSPLVYEAKFRMGICYTRLKKPKDAIRTLNELFSTFLAPARMLKVLTLLGENHLELKDRLGALKWFGKGLLVAGEPREELRKKVRAVIDTFDAEANLKQIESLYRGAYAGGYAKLRLAHLARVRGDNFSANKILIELEREYQDADFLAQARELSLSIRLSEKTSIKLGAILPMSGVHQPFGEKVLQGILLAMKEMNGSTNPPISLILRDSKGDPSEAEKAVEELAIQENVIAIIGPLLSIDLDKAAEKADQLKVPLLTFSQRENIPGLGEFIFQNSIAPLEQIRMLVTFAIQVSQFRTFGVFYPNSPYGIFFKNLFIEEVTRQGGKVVGGMTYEEGQTDFGREIRTFFRIKTVPKEEGRRKKEMEFKQELYVDGLFIPDSSDRVGLIISQIAYYDVGGLTFLGTNAWNGPNLVPVAGKEAEGSIFVDAFFKSDPSPVASRFVDEFQKAYQRDPGTLEALGYDAVKFLGRIIRSKSITSSLQMKEEMVRVQDFQGVSGLKGFTENGRSIRSLYVLRVNRGRIEKASP
jgi:branched-chain amino acid transport system substrate-binding protein